MPGSALRTENIFFRLMRTTGFAMGSAEVRMERWSWRREEFVGLPDHDDKLSADVLYEVVKLPQEHPEADMIYRDEDKLDAGGHRVEPFFKPDWSPEYMLAVKYT